MWLMIPTRQMHNDTKNSHKYVKWGVKEDEEDNKDDEYIFMKMRTTLTLNPNP